VDDALLDRARSGDRQALSQVLSELSPLIQRFGVRLCRNDADADDIAQDTLWAVASHLDAFEGRSSLSSWVFALARSACSRRRRGLKNQPPVSDDRLSEQAASDDPELESSQRELRDRLSEALAALSPRHREVLSLRDIEGLSAAEAANVLGLSVDALKSRLHRARAALKEQLAPRLAEPSHAPAKPHCPDVALALSKKLEGELGDDACAELAAHVATCPACARDCDALRSLLGACQTLRSRPAQDPGVEQQVRDAILEIVSVQSR
jgi:RNA polymerase sigma-70 factor (ECF subfamily)